MEDINKHEILKQINDLENDHNNIKNKLIECIDEYKEIINTVNTLEDTYNQLLSKLEEKEILYVKLMEKLNN